MKILLVCSVGGHLAQLHELQQRFVEPDDDVVWVTHHTPQSFSLLTGARVVWLDYIKERDVVGVLRALRPAWRLLRSERPGLVVSTGSAIALSFLPLARVLGARVAFIESAVMTEHHTRTGKLLALVPGLDLYTQSSATAGGRWRRIGSVFDDFVASRVDGAREPERIVVTVGTSQEFGFRGLIERVLRIVPPGTTVLWQTGSTDLDGLDIDATPWLPAAELEAAMARAHVVISHAGGGSALAALVNGKRPILVPRRADHGEFNDDHQEEITERLTERDLAMRGHLDTLVWDDVVEAAQWTVHRSEVPTTLPIRP